MFVCLIIITRARTRTTRENTPKTSRNKMAVDKAPGKKDKLTDAEKKKQKQANKVRSIFCPLNFTCFFFCLLLVVVQKISFSLFWITFVLPNDDLISLTTVFALSGESESGKGGGEESEERRQAGRPQRIRIAKSNQQIIIFCCSFPILRGVPL